MIKQIIPVSVIVPSYNSRNYLEDCINSINSGQWPAEILIIDDCSTDSSLALAIKLQSQFYNVRVFEREINRGAAESRKFGISASSQDWIAFVDADDLLETDALSVAYQTAIASCADICIWDLWRFENEKKWRSGANPQYLPKTGRDSVLRTLGGWGIHPLGVSKKIIYEKAYKGFSETSINADELLTRIVFSHATLVVGCEKRYLYRSNPESTTRVFNARRLSSLDSHLWLLRFAHQFPEAPICKMTLDAIWDAWFFWTKREQIGVSLTLIKLKKFLPILFYVSKSGTWLWRYPKYFAVFLYLIIRTNAVIIRSSIK